MEEEGERPEIDISSYFYPRSLGGEVLLWECRECRALVFDRGGMYFHHGWHMASDGREMHIQDSIRATQEALGVRVNGAHPTVRERLEALERQVDGILERFQAAASARRQRGW